MAFQAMSAACVVWHTTKSLLGAMDMCLKMHPMAEADFVIYEANRIVAVIKREPTLTEHERANQEAGITYFARYAGPWTPELTAELKKAQQDAGE